MRSSGHVTTSVDYAFTVPCYTVQGLYKSLVTQLHRLNTNFIIAYMSSANLEGYNNVLVLGGSKGIGYLAAIRLLG